MALVQVQRSPSSSNSSSTISIFSEPDDESEDRLKKSCSSFFAVKGAALFLPRGAECRPIKKNPVVGDLQVHLQSMFSLLRPQDSITLAVRLESIYETRIRYLILVSCIGVEDTEENILLGVDFVQRNATIGLVLPVWADTEITLNGDGGFTIKAKNRLHIFKPVSVQAMWSALQALNKSSGNARNYTYFSGGLNLTWTGFYESRILSNLECVREWNVLPDITSHVPVEQSSYTNGDLYRPNVRELTERLIVVKLREVLMNVDIEEVTSKQIRTKLEEVVGNNLKEFKPFIDEQMIIILRQMESPTQIFDFLYLGSEWNAGNLGELEHNGVSYILNVTKEIDNFFPGRFKYHNIRLYDVEESDLLRHWEDTHRFLSKAKETGSKVLVHCKMGVSRSAATVIAFAMKENRWTVDKALKFVKDKRMIINPNRAFRQQLQEYQGILDASDQRHNKLWRSKSESSLSTASSAESNLHVADIHLADIKPADEHPPEESPAIYDPRRRSWSPNEKSCEDMLGPSPEDPSVSQSANPSPMYLDSPTANNVMAGFFIGSGRPDTESEPLDDIQLVVPEVPISPIQGEDKHFPPPGYVSQKIFSIEGVTTSESTEEAEKDIKQQEEMGVDADHGMKVAEEPGMFLIEGAITGESTEDDIVQATKEHLDVEEETAGAEANEPSDDDDDETLQLDVPVADQETGDTEEGRKTPINFPMSLPLAEGRYVFPLDIDVQSVTSSCAVTVDDEDDYMRKAYFEDEDILEEDNCHDNSNPMPEEDGSKPDRFVSPEEKDVFFTPEEGLLPVLPVSGPNEELMEVTESPQVLEESEQMSSTNMEESEMLACGEEDKKDTDLQDQNDDMREASEVEGQASDAAPSAQELHLDIDENSSMNTNNNSSNENSPRGQTVVVTPVTKDLLSATSRVKKSLSPLERRNISLLSSSSQSPESPESDGYKTASSETTETPNTSPNTSKEYSVGYVRSRARCYETQISADSEDLSVTLDNSKSEPTVPVHIIAVEEVTDKTSIPHTSGSVLKQKKDIEERFKTESDCEGSPPVGRSTKVSQGGKQMNSPKEPSKTELSPPPSANKDTSFGSPSLQSLEKGIVKKLTKQLLSNETNLTKESSDTKAVETECPIDSVLDSSTPKDSNTTGVNTNHGKSQVVSSTEEEMKKPMTLQSTSETLQEQSKKTSDIAEQSSTELVSDAETAPEDITTYSKFGDEKIPLQPGIVKRHTQDFEQMSAEKLKEEMEKMEKASASETAIPPVAEPVVPVQPTSPQVTSSGSPDVSDEAKAEGTHVQSAYPEEGSQWCVGDVKKHKKVFEVMTDAEKSELLDSGIPFTVQMSQETWDQKLTQEERDDIKELGKIVLGRSDSSSEELDEEEKVEAVEEVEDATKTELPPYESF